MPAKRLWAPSTQIRTDSKLFREQGLPSTSTIKKKMAFDPQKDADLMMQKEAIRREKELIQKLEEENRRRMLRLAQQEKLEKDKRRNGR